MSTLAIVDSRNVHGQTSVVLGVGLCPTVPGIVDGLSLYGFDVQQVQVGLALARARDQQSLATEHAANTAYLAEVLGDQRGRALLGELHLKEIGPPRRVEEKIVDVQCALAIALSARDIADGSSNFDSIVVCSQDIDLRPALEYAIGKLGVPVWVAAHEVVDRRAEPFLLLTAESLKRFRTPLQACGHERRAQVAAAAMAPDVRTWTAVGPMGGSNMWLLEDADGTPGMCRRSALGPTPLSSATVQLGVAGISTGDRGNKFPMVFCDKRPAQAPLAIEGVVRRRLRLNKLQLDLAGAITELPYPAGGVMAGWKVAVQVNAGARGAPTHVVVGPINPPTVQNAVKLRVVSAEPVVATVTAVALSDFRTEVTSPHGTLVLDHPRGQRPPLGTRLAVVYADAGSFKFRPLVHAVSAALS